jgi:hypothetical protein
MHLIPILVRDIAQEAYVAARAFIEKELSGDHEAPSVILYDSKSMEDVCQCIGHLQAQYEQKINGEKTRKWLGECAARIVYYSRALDLLSQHYPEYVSLVWGTMKFVFMACIPNH